MKKACITFAVAACSLAASAQSFTVLTKDGKTIGFNSSDVENISFTSENLPAQPAVTVVPFNDLLTTFAPAEGVMDLDSWKQGVGRFDFTFNRAVGVNTGFEGMIKLMCGGETVYELAADSPSIIVDRDFISNTSSIRLVPGSGEHVEPGIYTLSIPDGFLALSSTSLVGGTARAYIIEAPQPAQTMSVTPAPGEVDELGDITFRFDNYACVELTGSSQAYINRAGDATSSVAQLSVADDGTVTVNIDPVIKSGGIYTVTIPAASMLLRSEADGKSVASDELRLVYSVEGQIEMAPPAVGDFYYSDGTWSSVLVDKGDVKPIGVVFYINISTELGDRVTNYTIKDGSAPMEEFHGYVVALRDATDDGVAWGPMDGKLNGCSTNTSDFLGYSNTKAIEAKAGGTLTESNFPAAYWATVGFDMTCPAPEQSSGWFLPSVKQLQHIYDNVYFESSTVANTSLENAFRQLAEYGGKEMYTRDAEYWTSTEYVNSSNESYRAYYFCFDESNFRPGFSSWYNKSGYMKVRSILAF